MPFEDFYSQYYDRVFKYFLKKTADFHLSEDMAMDVFTACCRNYSSYDPDKASLGTWVFTVAGNKLKNYYRDRKDFAQLDENSAVSDDMEDAVVQAQHTEYLRDVLADALETLNQVQRAVVILKFFKGKNSTEIAELTGLTSANVRAVSSRAVKKLKEYFEERGIEY